MNPVPLSVADKLEDDFSEFQDSVHSWDDYDQSKFQDLHARALELSRSDVKNGNLILAKLASVLGNDFEVERWCKNLDSNHHNDTALHMRFHHYVNMGKARKGQELLPEIVARRNDQTLVHLLHGAMAIGAFNAARSTLEEANMRNEVLVATTYLQKIRSTSNVIAEMQITDSHIVKLFDEAGALLRSYRLNWASYSLSIVSLPQASGGPAVSVEWPVGVCPAEAARLTWELTDRLVEKDLDTPGFSLGFLGVKLQ